MNQLQSDKIIREHRMNVNIMFLKEIGMTYDQYEKLDFDEQQEIMRKHRLKNKKKNDDGTVFHIVGYDDTTTFTRVKKGERIMLYDGTFVEAGITPEESRMKLDDKIDDMLYSKPISFVKKIKRRIKNR